MRNGVAASFGGQFRGTQADMSYTIPYSWTTAAPADSQVVMNLTVLIAKNMEDRFPLVVVEWEFPTDRLEVRMDDVYPQETADLQMLRRGWLERKVDERIASLLVHAQASRQSKGV